MVRLLVEVLMKEGVLVMCGRAGDGGLVCKVPAYTCLLLVY